MQHHTGSFTGLDNVTISTQHWLPEDRPRAVVIIVHGLGEHTGRYAHVAAFLTAHGYAVYALDLRGHGQSGGVRAMVRTFDEYVTDLRVYFVRVRAAHPNLPAFLYGHSMGSLIGLLFAFEYPDDLAGLITTGTALKLAGLNTVTTSLIKAVGSITPKMRLIPLDAGAVSRDPAVVRCYRADPLVYHDRLRAGLLAALARAAETCITLLPTLRVPYLALHGSADLLTHVAATNLVHQLSGAPDTEVKVYERLHHEIHNEPEQRQVFHDIVMWLDAHLPG